MNCNTYCLSKLKYEYIVNSFFYVMKIIGIIANQSKFKYKSKLTLLRKVSLIRTVLISTSCMLYSLK